MVFRPSPEEVNRHRLVLWMRQLVFQDNQERTEVELHDQSPFSGAVLVQSLFPTWGHWEYSVRHWAPKESILGDD